MKKEEIINRIANKLARILAEEDYGVKLSQCRTYPNESEYEETIRYVLTLLLQNAHNLTSMQSDQSEQK